MTVLAEVFELMHGGAESFQTVRVTVRVWRDEERNQRAFQREIEEEQSFDGSGGSVMMFAVGDPQAEPEPTETEETVRLWLERPGKRREEVDGPHPRLAVTDGTKMWAYMPELGAFEQELDPDGDAGEVDVLLHPERILPSAEIEMVGRTSVAGREGIALRAKRRRGRERPLFAPQALVPGADEYELVVDRELGVLLRTEARIEGEPFAISEVVEIAFDERFSPETFRFEPPEGETIRTPEEMWGGEEDILSVEEAAARASFPLWIPSRLPPLADRHLLGQAWEIHVHYQRARERPPMPEFVSLTYWHESGKSLALHEQASGGPRDALAPWEPVELEGRRYLVWEPEGSKLPVPIQIRVEREGTEVQVSSQELGRAELLEVARSLVRAPTESPPLTG